MARLKNKIDIITKAPLLRITMVSKFKTKLMSISYDLSTNSKISELHNKGNSLFLIQRS